MTENYFTVPDEIFELSSESGATKYLGAVSSGPGYLPPLAQGSLPPFHFPGRGGHNAVALCVQSLDTGTDRSQVLSRLGSHQHSLVSGPGSQIYKL